jgi:very-short-patch-repair endonuclease
MPRPSACEIAGPVDESRNPVNLPRGSCSMSREIEDRIAGLAAGQHGVITRAQLREAGLTVSAVRRRLETGRLRPLHLGVYQVGPLQPPRALEMAAVLATGTGSLVSHSSAASIWIPATRAITPPDATRGPAGITASPGSHARYDRDRVDVTIVAANSRRRPGIRVHRVARLDEADRTVLDGIPVTSPVRTLLDLAGAAGTREVEHAVACAEREGLVTRAALLAIIAQNPRRPGTPALRALLESEGGPSFTRSQAEAKVRALIRSAGLPTPEINVRIGPYELDFLWRTQGIAVEVDGFHHHSSRPRFEGDRRKDAWLLARGIRVLRLSWRQIVHEPIATAVLIGQALAMAKVEPR